jgi:periplasmic protein TonB
MTARDIFRWGVCFALVLGFHAAGAMALLARWNPNDDLVANAPVITIELAALPVAPETKPIELPPGPQQADAEPQPEPDPVKPVEKLALLPPPQPAPIEPVEKLDLPPLPQPELTVMPPPKPIEKPKETEKAKEPAKPKEKQKAQQKKQQRHRHASLASAPSTAETKAARAAAPTPGAASHNPYAMPNWKSRLVARLERAKRYPSEARARGEHGTAQLAFSVDRHGGVHHARIVRSSGSSVLDRETLALIARAAPLPPPPAEVKGAQIAIVVPIRYDIR